MGNEYYTTQQQNEIAIGRREGLDISFYQRPDLNYLQMHEIRLGLEQKLEVNLYAKPEYTHFDMKEIRVGLKNGFSAIPYINRGYPIKTIRECRKAARDGVDIQKYVNESFTPSQLREIRKFLFQKLPVDNYLTTGFSGPQLREIRKGLEEGIDITPYLNVELNWMQMQELRLGLSSQLNVKNYNNKFFSSRQMKEIRLGLELALDVSSYAKLIYSATDMHSRRVWLQGKQNQSDTLHNQHNRPSDRETQPKQEQDLETSKDEWFTNLKLTISEDVMHAVIEISDSCVFDHLHVDDIICFLKKSGVILGIKKDAIEQALQKRILGTEVEVATGLDSKPGKDGFYDFLFQQEHSLAPKLLEDGSVDYTEVTPFDIVEAGQTIAVYHKPEAGVFGYRVNGKMIIPHSVEDLPPLMGTGFHTVEDDCIYVADEAGRVSYEGGILQIKKIYIHAGDYSALLGKINFEGDIWIKGDVLGKAWIKGTGNIVVEGTVEASAVLRAEQNILIKQGVCSGNNGFIYAKGNIESRFFENADVYAKKSIKTNCIMNSNIVCLGTIELFGKKSSIIGGTVKAIQKITTNAVGNEVGLNTKIYIGIIDEYYKNVKEMLDKIERKKQEYVQMTKQLEVHEANQNTHNVKHGLNLEISMVKEEISELQDEMDSFIKSSKRYLGITQLIVQGYLYPGVEIHMNEATTVTSTRLYKKSFRLENGKIVIK